MYSQEALPKRLFLYMTGEVILWFLSFFGRIASWHRLNSFPALFFAARLLSGDAKALVQPAAPWEGFSSSGDFSEEDVLAALACSAVMVSIHMCHQSTVAWNSPPLP